MKKLLCIWIFAAVSWFPILAQSSRGGTPEYVPVLPSVWAPLLEDWLCGQVGGGVYVISDSGWQSAFLVTDEGVIVFDAPASFGSKIPSANRLAGVNVWLPSYVRPALVYVRWDDKE